MRTPALVGAFFTVGALLAEPADAQRVAADVVIRSGPLAGHIVVDPGYSSYTGERVVVYRDRRPVTRVIVVERFVHPQHRKHWRKYGYRPVTLYYRDGHYYDRYRPGLTKVVVYERDGRLYRAWDDDEWNDRRHRRPHRDHWDD